MGNANPTPSALHRARRHSSSPGAAERVPSTGNGPAATSTTAARARTAKAPTRRSTTPTRRRRPHRLPLTTPGTRR
jgi:hypothetical protein